MISILLILIFNSLYIFGIWYSTGNEMILEPLKNKLDVLPEYIKKPLYDCPICMSSMHSYLFPLAILFFGLEASYLLLYPFYIIVLAGLNGVLLSIKQ